MNSLPIITFTLLNLFALSSALGQSSFWLNNANGSVRAPVFNAEGFRLDGADYLAELWGGAVADSLTPALAFYSGQRVIVPFLSGGSAGYFRDTYAGRNVLDHPTVLNIPIASLAWLQVRAWDARLGATYEEVLALGIGGYGESPVFSAVGSSPYDLLGVPAPLTGLQSFSLAAVVPEPSTWALLACGGIGLWVARRTRRRVG